jgi:hypothetical protein
MNGTMPLSRGFMPKLRCELFGHFIYAEELSYSDLLETEARLKEDLFRLLDETGCVHVNFVSSGDSLLLQGALPAYDEDLFQTFCEAASGVMPPSVRARLFFLDRFLDSAYFCALIAGKMKEGALEFPDD